ncbi:MAG: protein kinase [Parachlamydiaceae bacterium]
MQSVNFPQLGLRGEPLNANRPSQLDDAERKVSSLSPSIRTIPSDEIEMGKELGSGGFGTVYLGTWNFQKVAVKRYLGSQLPQKVANEMRREVMAMHGLDHECLVRLFGIIEEEGLTPMLVMEYGAGGSLYTFLHSERDISWLKKLQLAEELSRGLAYLHSKGMIHRDIKSLNVVLDRDDHAKWCDFGLAQLKQHTTLTSRVDESSGGGVAGTVHWMAPELFERKSSTPSPESDIWALGMVFFELASREIPYKEGRTSLQVMTWIMKGGGEEIPPDCLTQAPDFAEVMKQCWQSVGKRPTAAQIAGEVDRIIRERQESKGAPDPALTSCAPSSLVSSGYALFSLGSSSHVLERPSQESQKQKMIFDQTEEAGVEMNLPTFMDFTYNDPTTGLSNTRRIQFDQDSGAIPNIQTKNTWLHIAAEIEHLQMLAAFILYDPQLNLELRNADDMTPLMVAFKNQKEKSARILLEAGANLYALSQKHGSALHVAATTSVRMMEIVIEYTGSRLNLEIEDAEGKTPLFYAIRADTALAIRLIDAGANIHKFAKDGLTYPLSEATWCCNTLVAKHLIQKGSRFLPSSYYSSYSQEDSFKSCLKGATPLGAAVCAGADLEMIKLFIDAGENPRVIYKNHTNLVWWAAYQTPFKQTRVLEYLLKEIRLDPNVQSTSDGEAPLHRPYIHLECVRVLVQYGANPNLQNHRHETPFYKFCEGNYINDRWEKIRVLLNAGADPNVKPLGLKTPFFEFVKKAFERNECPNEAVELTRLFIEKGATITIDESIIISDSPLFKNNPEFQQFIKKHYSLCTIM